MTTELLDSIVSSHSQELPSASSALKLFENPQFRVRVIMRCADPWFVAKDACDCLALSNVSKALADLDDDDKLKLTKDELDTLTSSEGIKCSVDARVQLLNLVSESGLYELIMRSRKPEAKAFKRWVNHEVLPSIRKTGSYSIGQTQVSRKDQLYLAIIHAESEAVRVEALKELAEINKQEVKALTVERDEAIRTKAEIGSKREAKAMATASAKSRECKRLETENDLLTTENSRLRQDYVENKDFCKQLRAQKLVVYVEKTLRDKCSKALQELSALMEIHRLEWNEWNDKAGREVPRYAYHKDVCAELKQRIIDNPQYLRRFK